ncbi:pre-peptidase C-terminal domain-containing protein [Leptolyngbya sp. AN02str]|uniref:pre-peptidase C-terminal domain-containing protein n=1 Tax=Leptolyngbya sp. AN02str TaxID=3423363 RepID=UPI003D322CC0
MIIQNRPMRRLGTLVAAIVTLTGVPLLAIAPSARAQILFEESGTLQPMTDDYTFEGTAGQQVTIAMQSEEFDTLLVLLGPDGQEVASNDDYGRSLNSTIVISLPANGTYTASARSFAGQGGNYTITVRPSTPYDLAYAKGQEAMRSGDSAGAIAAYTEAIEADPDQPTAYLDRADMYWSQTDTDAVVADYQRAIAIYERSGNMDMVQLLQEQLSYIQNPPTEESMPF